MARVFTVEQAAEYLQVSPYTLRKWLRRGRVRGRKLGRAYRILESDLELVLGLREQRVEGPKPEDRRNRAMELLGSCSHVRFSTADLAREHAEEIERDEAKLREPRQQWSS